MKHRAERPTSEPPEPTGIVSVNSRGAAGIGIGPKVAFGLLVIGLLTLGSISGYNRYRALQESDGPATSPAQPDPTQPAHVKPRKLFASSTTPLQPMAPAKQSSDTVSPCPDGEPAQILTGAGGQPIPDSAGKPLQVCKNGQLVLSPSEPMLGERSSQTPPSAVAGNPGVQAPRLSRFGGDVALNSATASQVSSNTRNSADIGPELAPRHVQFASDDQIHSSSPAMVTGLSDVANATSGQQGKRSQARSGSTVSAAMIGDRDMLVPMGRSIDCNLSMRFVTEVSGHATCVLSSHVYSDSGRVVLAERGSTVIGEYTSIATQGQRRIFVLRTRLQTPKGVVIDINSPAADALGTSGMPGEVDNRWRERIGAAVLLSLVEDAIGYQTAKASSAGAGSGAQGIAVFENSTRTGESLAERILDSTINIKPTVYKRQGDRATIFVNRDLDFGGVYALRAK